MLAVNLSVNKELSIFLLLCEEELINNAIVPFLFMNQSQKYGLAIHTSSLQLGLSLGNNRCQVWNLQKELATYLHQYLVDFLLPQTWQDLAFIAVAKGPGSFTSTRIGIVTARTLSQQLDIPLFAISSLAAFAWSQREIVAPDSLIAVEMEATQGQLYGAIYRYSATEFSLFSYFSDALMTPEMWRSLLSELPGSCQRFSVPSNLGDNVTSLLDLADQDWQQGKRPHWSEALPFYGN